MFVKNARLKAVLNKQHLPCCLKTPARLMKTNRAEYHISLVFLYSDRGINAAPTERQVRRSCSRARRGNDLSAERTSVREHSNYLRNAAPGQKILTWKRAPRNEACYMYNRTRCRTMKPASRKYRQERYLLLHQRSKRNHSHGSL